MRKTLAATGGVVVPIQVRHVPDEIFWLAAALRACGLGPEFCRAQRRDTDTWTLAAGLLGSGGPS